MISSHTKQCIPLCFLALVTVLVLGAAPASAASFNRVSTWFVYNNLPDGVDKATETAAEIIVPALDGQMVVYTDSPGEALGFLDISAPDAPKAGGRIDLGGEPTSVGVLGGYGYVGVNTSESYKKPSGHVAVVDLDSKSIVKKVDVGGQPDSVAVSPDGKYVAIAIENERDEEFEEGVIPQMPAGHLAILDLDGKGMPADKARFVELTGLAAVAPEDPEPEFVSINDANQVVVTLQENNHLAVVDLASGKVVSHFSAGAVDLENVDTEKDGVISQTQSIKGALREPDAVAWLDNDRFVIANEGDYKGGSRGFTIFTKDGKVEYESNSSLAHLAVSMGQYPEKRSGKKGIEPEGAAAAMVDGTPMFFIGAERANFVAVFEDAGPGKEPVFRQFLSTGVKPEGVAYIPERKLLVVANEEDSEEDHVRATVMLYAYGEGAPKYPTIQSAEKNGLPIPFGALSGLAASADDPNLIYAVPDSFYKDSRILTIDASTSPAIISGAVALMKDGKQASYDLEGISLAAGGGFWLVSEGNPKKEKTNLLLKVAPDGKVLEEITLPESVNAQAKRFGFEGVTSVGEGDNELVYVAFQREWNDDPQGMVRIGVYSPKDKSWAFMHYPLDAPESPAKGWVGLSEITSLGGDRFAIVERDNKGGEDARIKRVYVVSLEGVKAVPAGEAMPVLHKKLVVDVLPELAAYKGFVPDKVEGFAVTKDGRVFCVTDNDGVDDSTGETLFIELGKREMLDK